MRQDVSQHAARASACTRKTTVLAMDERTFADIDLVEELTTLVSRAAKAILDARAGGLTVRHKADASPVTAADRMSERILMAGLRTLLPGVPVISEEAAAASMPAATPSTFLLVDPLDGTYEFVAGRDEFTVNIALIENTQPVVGVIAAPALQRVWRGVRRQGAERLGLAPGADARACRSKTALRTVSFPDRPLRALVSRSHLDERTQAWLSQQTLAQTTPCGSALKFCRMAEGDADVYPRLAPTMEWDIAAGDALLTAAGGAVRTPEGGPLVYGRTDRGLRIPGFIAWSRPPDPA
jgi:3'(2'), 5'-bisphosphate nucleotidase